MCVGGTQKSAASGKCPVNEGGSQANLQYSTRNYIPTVKSICRNRNTPDKITHLASFLANIPEPLSLSPGGDDVSRQAPCAVVAVLRPERDNDTRERRQGPAF